MKIAIGADSYGFPLKETIKAYLVDKDYEITDFGVENTEEDKPYYLIATDVAKHVSQKGFDRAILFCGTGRGMAIIANKHPGIYASVCESPFAAEKSRSINNSNILTLGAMITTDIIAKEIIDVWLKTEFTEGWDTAMQDWLRNAIGEISSMECDLFG